MEILKNIGTFENKIESVEVNKSITANLSPSNDCNSDFIADKLAQQSLEELESFETKGMFFGNFKKENNEEIRV